MPFPMACRSATGSKGQNAAWWMAAGVMPLAAYQPKGAASLAASYVNLANPGTYNAAPGVAPTFAAATGWTFAAASTQWLTTGVTATSNTYSIIVRCVGGTSGGPMGVVSSPGHLGIRDPHAANATIYYAAGATRPCGTGTGRFAVRGVGDGTGQFYLNGVAVGAAIGGGWAQAGPIYLGALRFGANPLLFFTGNILAAAIYSSISEAQLQAVDAAMAAL